MARRVSRLGLSIYLFALLVHHVAAAQAPALTGRVVDPQRGRVGDADVTLTGAGRPRIVNTTTEGAFAFDGMPAGTYIVGERALHNYTTLPEEDFFSAAPIDAFNPVETQGRQT
jgi:hypothetical protein